MSAVDTFPRLRAVIHDATGYEPAEILPDAPLAEAIPDSLDRFEAILGAEEEFGVEISDAEAEAMQTVADFVALIDRKRGIAA